MVNKHSPLQSERILLVIIKCKFIYNNELFFIFHVASFFSDCSLSLQKDFSNPSPVYLRNNAYLAPNNGGAISLKRSETITVACPGDRRLVVLGNVTSSYNTLEAHCVINTTFRVDRWIGQFKDIKCNSQPTFTTQESSKQCYNAAKLYGVGYKIKSKFHQLYEACFNSDLLSTHYVKHVLEPSSRFIQPGVARSQFKEGDMFGKVSMTKVYKLANQKARLDAILGPNMSDKYITNKQFLTRGHLAARADYTLRAELRATFHYVNAAPQWQRGNAGDWQALEEALRRRVQSRGRAATVYTGTHGVVTLADRQRTPRDIYLYADGNNNLQVPVPLYFYKLVYDPKEKTATAFITINSSYYNDAMVEKLTFCEDVCEGNSNFNWLRWRNDDTPSFCCNYEEFQQEVDYLDKLNVTGLFY